MTWSRQEYDKKSARRRVAFKEIAKAMGTVEHPITKMLGPLAWGRHDAEQGPDSNLRSAIMEFGFLEGYYACVNRWARDNNKSAQQTMINLWNQT